MSETKEVLELLLYSLAKIPVLQKHSKLQRMSGCNYSFIIEKRVIHRMDGCNWGCELTQYL